MLILNADDFGKNALLNRGIAASFRQGLCSSATLMATGLAFEEACQLARENRFTRFLGVHLALNGQAPLTDGIRRHPCFCDAEGKLIFRRTFSSFPVLAFSGAEKKALAAEIRSQIAKIKGQGIQPTHLDSHFHVHNEWAVAAVLLPILREEGIPYLRGARNFCLNLPYWKRPYKWLMNRRIARRGLLRTRYFGGVDDYLALHRAGADRDAMLDSCEIMLHPIFNDRQVLVDRSVPSPGPPLADIFADLSPRRAPVSFLGERYGGGAD